jgi:hypothetical protein
MLPPEQARRELNRCLLKRDQSPFRVISGTSISETVSRSRADLPEAGYE